MEQEEGGCGNPGASVPQARRSHRLGWLKQRRPPRPLVKGIRRAQEVRFIESQGRWALPAHGQAAVAHRQMCNWLSRTWWAVLPSRATVC